VLQGGAVCCSALQCFAENYSALQRVATCVAVSCSVLQCVVASFSVLQRAALCCSMLHSVAVCCNVLKFAKLPTMHAYMHTYLHTYSLVSVCGFSHIAACSSICTYTYIHVHTRVLQLAREKIAHTQAHICANKTITHT